MNCIRVLVFMCLLEIQDQSRSCFKLGPWSAAVSLLVLGTPDPTLLYSNSWGCSATSAFSSEVFQIISE